MKLTLCICLCLAAAILDASMASACAGPPPLYFTIPSYINPNYKVPAYSEETYNRRTKFEMLLREYAVLDSTRVSMRDFEARAISQQREAELYSSYVRAADSFHTQGYRNALKVFIELRSAAGAGAGQHASALGDSNYSWVREASTYMIARCQLIMAQHRYDGYWDPTHTIEQNTLRSADSSYLQYLKEYPDGIYANSARNIRRRIYLLSGQQALLDKELRRIMAEEFPVSSEFSLGDLASKEIVDEFETHFRGAIDFANDAPVLTAYAWLGPEEPKPDDLTLLESREGDFLPYPGLLHYVRALGLYRLGRYQELLDKTPEEKHTDAPLWLSTQLLRERAYARLGDYRAALELLEQMHTVSGEDAIDVEIATLQLNNGYGLVLFTDASPVIKDKNLQVFAVFGLTDEELQLGISKHQISANRRQILLDDLARRYTLSGRYAELVRLLDKEQIPAFMPAKAIAARLSANPHDIEALADMGEFLYENYITPRSLVGAGKYNLWGADPLDELLPRCEPCKEFATRVAAYHSPMSLFMAAVENAKRSRKRTEAEAKALHYIVRGGRSYLSWSYRCTWSWSEPGAFERSQAAFFRLHKLYKDSPWATATPYYYR